MTDLPTTAEGIYDRLAGDATLVGMLGTCRFPDAEEPVPALAVLLPLEEHPAGTVIEGVEVTINREPDGQDDPFMTGGGTIGGTFRLYVTQWSVAPGAPYQVGAVARRIARLLPGAQWRDNTMPDGLGGLAQLAMTWEQPEIEESLIDPEDEPVEEPDAGEP